MVMVKTITKIGNSHGIIFDSALMELTGLKAGDEINLTIHDGGSIVITPVGAGVDAKEAGDRARTLIRRNSKLFKRLA